MQKDNKFFDDMSRMMSGAAGTMFDAKREIEQQCAAFVEKFLLKMNFVSREEFEVVRDMASKARAENEALKARLDALEAHKKPSK
ncbi:MAG: accessory factor UbiK family protein [Rickettsiales bacterium]|nr:accessory factor UbiK family protein [Rickettsiales bacterium]